MAVVAAAGAAIVVGGAARAAEAARDDWGRTRAVLVATATIEPGSLLDGMVEVVEMPFAMVPADAPHSLGAAATAAQRIDAGAIVGPSDVIVDGPDAIGSEEAAVAVPSGPATPAVVAGADVLVVVHGDAFTGIVAQVVPARVLTVGDAAVTVVVPRADLVAVSAAAAAGSAAIALAG